MRSVRRTLLATVFTLAVTCASAQTSSIVVDPGAGPITASRSPCLIAHLTKRDECPEPRLLSDNSAPADRVASRLARASYYVDIQEIEKALVETDAALAIDPDYTPARHLAARLSMVLGDGERAQRDAFLARKHAPDDPAIRTTYAIALQGRQANAESFTELTAIIKANPRFLFAREQRAELLMRASFFDNMAFQYAVALEDYNYVIENGETTANLFASRARAFRGAGRPDSAAADLSSALKLEPDRYDLLTARADAYVGAQLDELAVKDFDVLLAMTAGSPLYAMSDGDRASLLAKRAGALVRLRQFEKATDDIVAALSAGGQSAVLRAQVFLRSNGFSDVVLDGKNSPALRAAIS